MAYIQLSFIQGLGFLKWPLGMGVSGPDVGSSSFITMCSFNIHVYTYER